MPLLAALLTGTDNASCGASDFNLSALVPSGWSAVLNNPTLAINPATTASTTLQVTAPVGAADGFYNFSVTAANSSDPAYTDNASGTVVIASSLAVNVLTDKGTYSRNQNVTVTVTVSSAGSPIANATVNLTITKSNGSTLKPTLTTGANGTAVYKFRLGKKDPVGVYQVKADASANGISGSATTSFNVQ